MQKNTPFSQYLCFRLTPLALALGSLLAGHAAVASTWTNPADGSFHNAANWDVAPAANADVEIGVVGPVTVLFDNGSFLSIDQLDLFTPNTLQIDAGTLRINSLGSASTNSGTIDASGTGTFRIQAGSLDNSSGTLRASGNGNVNIVGATITGGTLDTADNGVITANNSTSNFLDGVTLNGTLDLASSTSVVRLQNDLELNGDIEINSNSVLTSNGTNTISGNGRIILGSTGASNRIALDGNGTTTIGSGVTIEGENGTIGNAVFVSGTQALINDGTISANVSGGNINIAGSAITNNGTLEAQNGGQLTLSSNVTGGVGSQINVGNASTVLQNGVTLSGDLNSTGSGVFRSTSSSNNFLDGVSLSGDLDLATANGSQRVINDLELNGRIDLNNNSILAFEGTNTLSGNAEIVFGSTGASNRLALDGAGDTVFGANTVVRGENGTIGNHVYVSGTQTLTNNGRISADVGGGTLTIAGTPITNNGILEAQNGGTLNLTTNVTAGAGGQITAGAASTVLQSGVTITGTVNAAGSGSFRPTNSSGNFLDGVTFSGDLDLASANSAERVVNDLELNGRIDLNNNSVLAFEGTNTLSGNAEIVFGSTGASNRLALDGAGDTVFGANTVVHGENGTIGNHVYVSGTQTLTNNGRISADVGGGTLTIAGTPITNNGILEAQNGGTLNLTTNVTAGSGSQIIAGSGSTVLQSGVTITGDINAPGSGSFRAINSSANFLDSVSFTGDLDLASGTSVERVINDLEFNGQVDINGNSVLAFEGDNTISGNASIVLGDTGASNRIALDGAGTTTFGSNVLIRGQNGTIGNQVFVSGTQLLDNDGTISADVGGGLITVAGSVVENSGLLQATNGAQLTLSSTVNNSSSGVIDADNGVVLQSGIRITNGTLTSDNGGVVRASNSSANFLNGVTLDGVLDMATSLSLERIENGLTVNGRIDINSNSAFASNGTNLLDGNGEIVFGNTGSSNRFLLDGAGTTTIGENLTVRGENGTIGNALFVSGTQFLVNNGLISADVAGGTITLSQSAVTNNGTLQAANGGTLAVSVNTDNQGLVEALADSLIDYSGVGTTLNNSGGTLTGGIWRANSVGGTSATVSLVGSSIDTNDADVQLIGADADIDVAGTSLENSLHTNNLALRLQQGHTFSATANGGDFTNNGILEVSDSGFVSTNLLNDGAINSFGNSSVQTGAGNQVSGSGSIQSSFGTLSISDGVNMDVGSSMTSNTGAALDLSSATLGSRIDTLNNNGSLALGAQDMVVTKDYTNANFGTGNSFDRRANVSGAGQLIGNKASQTLTGNVIATAPNTFSLDLGNVRGGTSASADFQIQNDGTGADIRGALQNSGLSDARLSGTGTVAGNFGPIAAGDSSGTLKVTFDAVTGGSLSGQRLEVVSNFDNVATQVIDLSGQATALAVGNATPDANPVDLGNFRVGVSAPSQDFAVQNTTNQPLAEQLGIASAGASGNFAATNNLGAGLINGGETQAAAISASVNGGVAGVNTGTLDIQYTTDGTAVDALFVAKNSNAQSINLKATGYQVAQAAVTPQPVVLANQRVGGTVRQALSVSNTDVAPAGFQEGLDATLGGTTGDALSSNGVISNLGQGASNNSAFSVGVDTGSAGAKSGNVSIATASNGSGTSGLGTLALGTETVTVSGNVYQLAEGQLNTAALNFGTVQVGQSVTQALSFTNSATGAAGFVEDLNVGFGATSGTGSSQIIGSGGINGLLAGATDAASMMVSVDTSAAGTINGAIQIDYTSAGAVNGVSNGLGLLSVGGESYGVSGLIETTGSVIDQADPQINNPVIALGNVRIGSVSPSANVSVTNVATGNTQAALNATISGNAPVTASGSFNLLDPGATDSSSLSVGMDTSVAGAVAGTATLGLVSDASNVGGCAPNCEVTLLSQDVNVSGAVYRLASPTLNTGSVTLVARRGDAAPGTTISVSNTSPDSFTESLDANISTTSADFVVSGAVDNLVAGATDNANLVVALDTSTAGAKTAQAELGFVSTGDGTTGAADVSVGSAQVALNGKVYEKAVAQIDTPSVDFGIVHVGDVIADRAIGVSNAAPVAGLNDVLTGGVGGVGGPFTAAGNLGAGVAAGASDTGSLLVGLSTASSGVFNSTAFVTTASHNDDMADLALGSTGVGVTAQVNEYANASLRKASGIGALSGGGASYELDLGTLVVGTVAQLSGLEVFNDVLGPADDLAGRIVTVDGDDFGYLGLGTFSGLGAGGSSLLQITFDPTAIGAFSDELLFTDLFGSNASGYSGALADIRLLITGNVMAAPVGSVPLPSPLVLMGLLAALLLVRSQQRCRAA